MLDNDNKFFLLVPVEYIRTLYLQPTNAATVRMARYGLCKYASIVEDMSLRDAYRTVLYEYMFRVDTLPDGIRDFLDDLQNDGILDLDNLDRQGFDTEGYSFECDDLLDKLVTIDDDFGECSTHPQIEEDVQLFASAKLACDKARIDLCDTPKFVIQTMEYSAEVVRYLHLPHFSISFDTLLEFNMKKKSHSDVYGLAMLCGIRSIIGNKEVATTNRAMVLARSVGCSTPQELDDLVNCCDPQDDKLQSIIIDELQPRRLFEKRINRLEYQGFIKTLHMPGERFFYVSTLSEDEMVDAIIEAKRRREESAQKQLLKSRHDQMKDRILTGINICTS